MSIQFLIVCSQIEELILSLKIAGLVVILFLLGRYFSDYTILVAFSAKHVSIESRTPNVKYATTT